MNKPFIKSLFIFGIFLLVIATVPTLNLVRAGDEGDKDYDELCIPNPFPPDWSTLHKDWQKLHLLPCKPKNPPPPTPTPPPPPPPGGGQSNSGGGSTGGGNSQSGSSCGDPKPSSAPTLTGVTDLSSGKMQLSWTPVSPVNHYSIAYGRESGKYIYGATDVGNVTNYIVASLERGKSYCFVVSAVNGCTSSGFSNEKCSGQVLGASTGQVLGLSNTSSDNRTMTLALGLFGLLCVMSGAYLRKLKPS